MNKILLSKSRILETFQILLSQGTKDTNSL